MYCLFHVFTKEMVATGITLMVNEDFMVVLVGCVVQW